MMQASLAKWLKAFDRVLFKKDIFGLDITVDEAHFVDLLHPPQDLGDDLSYYAEREALELGFLQEVEETKT